MSPADIEKELTHPVWQRRLSAVCESVGSLTEMQIERIFKDNVLNVPMTLIQHPDFELTPHRIQHALQNTHFMMRLAIARRIDMNSSPELLEQLLTDQDASVRAALAERADFLPTLEQEKRGRVDNDYVVRSIFQRREIEFENRRTKKQLITQFPPQPIQRRAL
jgi:hypothetical protein